MNIFYRHLSSFFVPAILLTFFSATLISCDSDDDGPDQTIQEEEDDVLQFGLVTDRDGNSYTTVFLGDREWMAENLNTASAAGLSRCYGDDNENCNFYGLLYTLEAVLDGETTSPGLSAQGLCPDGWRLPTREDWNALPLSRSMGEWSADELKSESDLWTGSAAGSNASGFSALPGGLAQVNDAGDFNYVEEAELAAFWSVTSTDSDAPQFGFFGISAEDGTFEITDYQSGLNQTDPDSRAHSCRCLRDI